MNDIESEIKFYKDKLEETRTKLADTIIEAITDENTFWEYYHLLHDVLPVGTWVGECPENLSAWLHQTDHKEAVRYFDNLLDSLEEYRDDLDSLEKYFSRDGTEIKLILEKNSTWDLIKQIIEFTKKNRICGTAFDW